MELSVESDGLGGGSASRQDCFCSPRCSRRFQRPHHINRVQSYFRSFYPHQQAILPSSGSQKGRGGRVAWFQHRYDLPRYSPCSNSIHVEIVLKCQKQGVKSHAMPLYLGWNDLKEDRAIKKNMIAIRRFSLAPSRHCSPICKCYWLKQMYCIGSMIFLVSRWKRVKNAGLESITKENWIPIYVGNPRRLCFFSF